MTTQPSGLLLRRNSHPLGKCCYGLQLCSAGITPPRRSYGPIRHPLAVGRFPGGTGYTAYLAPPISRRDEEGFSTCLTCPGPRAVAHTPPERNHRVSQTATILTAFAKKAHARPPGLYAFGATLAFTHVTARQLAHRPYRRLRRWASELWFPSALPSKLRGVWLLPRWDCLPLNTFAFVDTHFPA